MFDPERVSTVTFDSYSTLVDVAAARDALAERVADPTAVSRLWRRRSLEYSMVAAFTDAYQPFYEMNRDALTYALARAGEDLSETERDEVLAVYHDLDVFDDVRGAVEELVEAGYPCYVLSNGNPEMLDSMVADAGIGDLLSGVVSADEVGTFKPDRELYRHAAGRTGTPVGEVVHVTAGWFDVLGAQHAGMQGAWVNRKDRPWEAFGPDPDLAVSGLDDLVAELT